MGLPPLDSASEQELIAGLKHGVSSVRELEIVPNDVSPFLVRTQVQPGETEVIVVNFVGLLWREKRTQVVLNRVAAAVIQVLEQWVTWHSAELSAKSILLEVFIEPFDCPCPCQAVFRGTTWLRP
ncbi:MAG: hypothetical protein V1846_01725 [Candidatus Komeilibacteria bacterium]